MYQQLHYISKSWWLDCSHISTRARLPVNDILSNACLELVSTHHWAPLIVWHCRSPDTRAKLSQVPTGVQVADNCVPVNQARWRHHVMLTSSIVVSVYDEITNEVIMGSSWPTCPSKTTWQQNRRLIYTAMTCLFPATDQSAPSSVCYSNCFADINWSNHSLRSMSSVNKQIESYYRRIFKHCTSARHYKSRFHVVK